MSWSAITIKYLLFFFNLLFVISGIIIISLGVTVKAEFNDYGSYFLGSQYFSAPNLLIAVGSFIFLTAFFGCCGAIKQNYCMIITFCSLLVLIFIMEFAAGISGYVLRNETADYLNKTLYDDIKNYNKSDTAGTEITLLWDTIQEKFECCGVENFDDWNVSFNGSLPLSCCRIPKGTVGSFVCNTTEGKQYVYQIGCRLAFGNFVRDHAVSIGSVGLGFAAIQILAVGFACYLAKQVKLSYEFM